MCHDVGRSCDPVIPNVGELYVSFGALNAKSTVVVEYS